MSHISAFTLVVPDYQPAVDWFVRALGFELVVNADQGEGKRWVMVAPKGGQTRILLAKAANPRQASAIGAQTGGRVGFFLTVDDFAADHARMSAAGVRFTEAPRQEPYGWVCVFEDPWGNRWDLLGRA